MSHRLIVLTVALGAFVMGLAAGWLRARAGSLPDLPLPDVEVLEPGQYVLILRTDSGLDASASVQVAGDGQVGRQWVFSFRDPEHTRRAYDAVRDAATAEHRRALNWP